MINKIITILLLSTITFPSLMYTQNGVPPKPTLVIGIVVDQMRHDYLYRFYNHFGEGGFKRLMQEGFIYEDCHYNYFPTFTGPGHTSIYTGTTPSIHGIVANTWFDRNKGTNIYCAEDKDRITKGGSQSAAEFSPKRLLGTTITDELRIESQFKSKVFGIALKDRGSILPAGHNPNGAFWFDGETGNFISNDYYYSELPDWVQSFNNQNLAKKYLEKRWETLLPISHYELIAASDHQVAEGNFSSEEKPVFPHDIPEIYKKSGVNLIKAIPAGNAITTDFALSLIKNENLGKGETTDFLALSYSSTDYVGHQFGPHSIELADTYLRLDKDLKRLLDYIYDEIGKENVVVFLTSDHGASDAPVFSMENKMPAGLFDRGIIEKLGIFLEKKYQKEFKYEFINSQIYFDRNQLIQDKLDLQEISEVAASWLENQPQIAHAISSWRMGLSGFNDREYTRLRAGYYPKRSGDVFIINDPGIVDMGTKQTGTTHGTVFSYDTRAPMLWWGGSIPQGKSYRTVNITDIASTIANIIKVKYPSGNSGKPMTEILK